MSYLRHSTRIIATLVITLVSVGCVSFDYSMGEYNTPVYSALDQEVLNRLTDEQAVWRTSLQFNERRRSMSSRQDNRFFTLGPGEPSVFLEADTVHILLFDVTTGAPSVVDVTLVSMDLNEGQSDHAITPTVLDPLFGERSVSIEREIARPADLTGEDLAPILASFEPRDSWQEVTLYTLDDLQATVFREVQLVAPEAALYLYIETGLYRNLHLHHWFAARLDSSADTIASIANEDIRRTVQEAEAQRRIAEGTPETPDEATTSQPQSIDLGEDVEDGVVTVPVDGGTYTGEVSEGQPDGEGRLEYEDGRVYEGGFSAGRFQGRAVLSMPDGRRLETTFNEGVPDGEGMFYFAGDDAYEVEYDSGRRVDTRYLQDVIPTVEEAEELRNRISTQVREGLPESRYADDIAALAEINSRLDGNTGPERLLFEFQIEDQLVRFQANEDGLVISRYEEFTVEDEDGTVLAIYREGDRLAVTDEGIGLRIQREELDRLREPAMDARFLTLTGSGGIGFGSSTFLLGGGAGFDYRYMNNSGEPLPGPAGGDGRGWDFRGVSNLTADLQSYDGESDFILSLDGGVSVGRTRYSFDPLDQETLGQTGSGRTFGLQLLVQWDIVRPPLPEELQAVAPDFLTRSWRIIPAPFVSFETYRYSPGSVSLESRTTDIQLLLGGVIGVFVRRTLVSF